MLLLLALLGCDHGSDPSKAGVRTETDDEAACPGLDASAAACSEGFPADTGWCPSDTDICDGAVCALDLSIETARVTGRLTEDGATPFEDGVVYFRNTTTRAGGVGAGAALTREILGYAPAVLLLLALLACDHHHGTVPDRAGAEEGLGECPAPDTAAPACSEGYPADTGWCPAATDICEGGTCALDLAVETVHVSGRLSEDGKRLFSSKAGVYFRDTTSGANYYAFAAGGYSIDVPPGTYDVSYSPFSWPQPGGWGIPLLRRQEIRSDQTLDLAADLQHLSGTVGVDGIEGPPSGGDDWSDDWSVTLTDTETGRALASATVTGAGYDAVATTGLYDVWLNLPASYEGYWGCYASYSVASALPLESSQILDLHVAEPILIGTVTWDGAAPPAADGDGSDFLVRFFETTTGASYCFGGSDGAYTAVVPSGTYDVAVKTDAVDGFARAAIGVVVTHNTVVDLTVETVAMAGVATWNGHDVELPASVLLTDRRTGERIDCPVLNGGRWECNVPIGEYDVVLLAMGNEEDGLPSSRLPIGDAVIASSGTLDLRAQVYRVCGAVSLDGVPIPDAAGEDDDFDLLFEDEDRQVGAWIPGHGGRYDGLFPAGSYDVWLSIRDQEENGIADTQTFFHREISADTTLDLGACLQTVTGSAQVDGEPASGNAKVVFAEAGTGTLYGADASDGTYTIELPPGDYDALVWPDGASGPMPAASCVRVE